MGVAINTLGVTVSWAVESTKGTRPTTGYAVIPNIKTVPDMNPAPEAMDYTDLSATEYKTYISGLKDLGGVLSFTANLTEELITEWGKLITAYKGLDGGKSVWFEIKHPKLAKAVYFTGEPAEIGLPEIGVNAVLETSLHVVPTNEPAMHPKQAL